MGKPHPMALRERVAAYVEEGHGHREAGRHFRVSPRFVNDLMKLRRETGSLEPRRQGHAPLLRCGQVSFLTACHSLPDIA